MASNLKIAVSADSTKAIDELKKVNSTLGELKPVSEKASSGLLSISSSGAKVLASMAAASVATTKLVSIAKDLVKMGSEEALAEQKLTAVLKASGNQIGINSETMRKYADSISEMTGMEEKSILAAEQTLASFGTLNSDGFERTLELATDVSMALGRDMADSAKKLGEVLSEPTSGLDGLKEIGIIFTQQEKDQIAAVREANGLYAAQSLVLDKVEKSYGGAAASIGNSSANLLTKIDETWSDIKSDLGQGLLDSITPALESLLGLLQDISQWVKENTSSANVINQMKRDHKEGVSTDFSQFSDLELELALSHAQRNKHKNSVLMTIISELETALDYRRNNPVSSVELNSTPVRYSSIASDDGTPEWKRYLQSYGSNSVSYQKSIYDKQIAEAEALRRQMIDSTGWNKATMKDWGIGYTSDMEALYLQLGEIIDATKEKRDALFEAPVSLSLADEISAFINQYSSLSQSFQDSRTADSLAEIDSLIARIGETSDPVYEKQLTYLQEIRANLSATEGETVDIVQEILSSYGNLSESFQKNSTAEAIDEIRAAMEGLAEEDSAKTYLQEILDSLTQVEDESLSVKDAILSIGNSVFDTFSSIASSLSTIWGNQASALESSLKMQKETGTLTVAEEEEIQDKINDLRKKSFEAQKANSLANATVSLASGTMKIWEEYAAMPVVAGILTAGLGATYAAQVAAIGSQQYTPMATGGIVTGPTRILAGEAGPEAIIPLKDRRASEFLGKPESPVVINITIQGNADEETVFNAIERAQRTGLLPAWRFAR